MRSTTSLSISCTKRRENHETCAPYRARKSRVYIPSRYEIHAIIVSLGTVRAQPRLRSHVKSMGDFRLLQITVI